MTIDQAIVRLDALKYNTYSRAEKRFWLSQLDSRVRREVLDTHENPPETPFTGYDDKTPGDMELLIPAPYDELYLNHLGAMVDFHNGEIEKYNNAATLFHAGWEAFTHWYNRTHLPLGSQWRYR